MPHRRVKPALSPEREQQIHDILLACKEASALLRTLSDQRTRLFRELHAEGWKVKDLAALAQISPQRMSKVLNPEVTPRHSLTRPLRARGPHDSWL